MGRVFTCQSECIARSAATSLSINDGDAASIPSYSGFPHRIAECTLLYAMTSQKIFKANFKANFLIWFGIV
jgi:hypothetical protein